VIYLEDDDVAAVKDGMLSIHRIFRNSDDPNKPSSREVTTLKLEIQQLMKGSLFVSICFKMVSRVMLGCYCFIVPYLLDVDLRRKIGNVSPMNELAK